MESVKVKILLDSKEAIVDVETATLYAISSLNFDDIGYEVLKALVVLKRSEIFKCVKNTPYYEKQYEISLKKKKMKKTIKKAIDDTKGEVVLSNDKLVSLYYTMSCGGATSNSEDVIGEKINFLRRIYCSNCSKNQSYKRFTLSEYEKLEGKESSFKEESQNVFNDVERDESGRIKNLNFLGDRLTGKEFMKKLNLKSNRVYFKEEVIRLKVEGEGDGLGICIEGAEALSKEGKSYKDIIEYYYTGIVFENIEEGISNSLGGKVFLIDPGHGGDDSGNVRGNIKESDIVLKVASKLKKLLEEKQAKVHLTRSEDEAITLTDRAEKANEIRPDFLISLHLNAFIMPGVNGSEAHCYDEDIEAIELSELILDEVEKDVGFKKRKVNIGDYFILRESRVSSLILEYFYLTGGRDIELLTDGIEERLALATFNGICRYYDIVIENIVK